MDASLAVAVIVGLVWGFSNTFIRVGVLRAQTANCTTPRAHLSAIIGEHWASLLTTPSFVLPQLANWAASAVMVSSLASSKLHIATPVANSVSIAATAATGLGLEDNLDPLLLACGVICIAVGSALTGL